MTDQAEGAKKKRGRPAKEHRPTFSFRLSNTTRAKLQEVADETGLSLSEEIERRLEQSFSDASTAAEMLGGPEIMRLMMTFAMAAQMVEAETGKRFYEDADTNLAMKTAFRDIIDLIKSPPAAPLPEMIPLGKLSELGKPIFVGKDAAVRAVTIARNAVAKQISSSQDAPGSKSDKDK